MLSILPSDNDENESNIIDFLYQLCKRNELEEVKRILPFIGNINLINKLHTVTGSTCLHVACYYGHRDMVKILLDYGATHSIRNLRHSLTAYEETHVEEIKQLFLEHKNPPFNNDYNFIQWSLIGDDLLSKRREFRKLIDVYKTYDNHLLVSKLLAEVIHYYLNEYLLDNARDDTLRAQIETIESYFKEAIDKQDYLTYFIKAYTLTNIFYHFLNKDLALYILEYFDQTKTFSSNYRLVNCLVHLVTLLIYHPNLPQYQYRGVCYRGMRITTNDLEQYQINHHILNRAFLSTSLDRQVAEMFAGEGQQSQMRHTPKDHCALLYSCVCQYVVKQDLTAINIENLSTRPDEKEVLIIPFSVFKITSIKRNYIDNPQVAISIEIELEECEDPDKLDEQSSRLLTVLSSENDIKDAEAYTRFKRRRTLLYGAIAILTVLVLIALSVTLILIFAIKKPNPNYNSTLLLEKINRFEYQLPFDCPRILNRTSWNARPYIARENLTIVPVTHIVIRQLADVKNVVSQQDCIKAIRDLQDFQIDIRGWADIGYNFLMCNDKNDHSEIYRGRGWMFRGAHCISYNFRSLGNHSQNQVVQSVKDDEKQPVWDGNKVEMISVKLADGVYALYAKDAEQLNATGGAAATSGGLIIGEHGVLLIETFLNQRLNHQAQELSRKLSRDKPILFAVNTSSHGDHWYG
ncbi:unnamed protein product, partial [Adineta ricciae]